MLRHNLLPIPRVIRKWNIFPINIHRIIGLLIRSSPIEIEQHEVFVVSHNEIGIPNVAMNVADIVVV